MAYSAATGQAWTFLGYIPLTDFSITNDNGTVLVEWLHGDPQPTEQATLDALNDLTTVNGQTFSQWLAEHGDDANLTRRRIAKEALDGLSGNEALIRALALTIMDELNILRAEHALAPRTGTQLRNAIKAKLDAGDADT